MPMFVPTFKAELSGGNNISAQRAEEAAARAAESAEYVEGVVENAVETLEQSMIPMKCTTVSRKDVSDGQGGTMKAIVFEVITGSDVTMGLGESHNIIFISSGATLSWIGSAETPIMLQIGETYYPLIYNGVSSVTGESFTYKKGTYLIYFNGLSFCISDNGKLYGDGSEITNIQFPDATSDTKGVVMIESTPTADSAKAITSGGVKTALDALDERISDLEYVPVAITSMSVSPNLAEIGSTQTAATLTYAMNRDATQMKLDGNAISNTEKSGTIALTGLSLSANKTWTLQATDERKSLESEWVSKTATLTFTNKVKYGVAAAPGTINDTFLNGLSTKTLSTGKISTFSVDAGTNQYIWYALPTSYGTCTFTVGGFTGGFTKVAQFNHTNESGATVEYRVYRSDNVNLGVQTINVS